MAGSFLITVTFTDPQHPKRQTDRGGRIKFADFQHELMPPPLNTWQTALLQYGNKHDISESKVPWGYWLPEAALLISSDVVERRQNYILTWLRIRDPWLYICRSIRHRQALPARFWRMFLNEGLVPPAPNVQAGHKKANQADKDKDRLRNIFIDAFQEPLRTDKIQPQWFGTPIIEPSPQVYREVVWELCELGFRVELLMLDLHLVGCRSDAFAGAEHMASMRKIFPGSMALQVGSMPSCNVGLASDDAIERATALDGLVALLKDWPRPPEAIVKCPLLAKHGQEVLISKIEGVIAQFYVETFCRYAGRAAVLPRRIPLPAAPS